jgi:virginiamycin B lyase
VKRIIITIVAVGLVVPAVAVASRVATGSTRTAIAPGASEASRAGVHIYWTSSAGTSHGIVNDIGRAKLNGTGVDRRFIALPRAIMPWGVAVNGQNVYWTAIALPAVGIGRANLNGTGINQRFMPVMRMNGVVTGNGGLAVAGGYIYWANGTDIGRANLDGTDINPNFIPGSPAAITIAGGYIYWANEDFNVPGEHVAASIGRANLDGTGVNQSFIVGAHGADAVTVAGGYIYWANEGSTTIGRAKLNGTRVNQRFMTNTLGLALASDGPYIYGSDFSDMWRAKLNGTSVNRHFIPLSGDTFGIAIH